MPKIRHHYLPRFYLDGFADPRDGCIWVYEKGKGEVIRTTSRRHAVERHYYSFTKPDGTKDSDTIEDCFSDVEMHVPPIIRKLEAREVLNDNDRHIFSMFLGLMMTRVPNFRKNIEKMYAAMTDQFNRVLASDESAFRTAMEKYERETGDVSNIPIEKMRQYVLSDEYKIVATPAASLPHVGMGFDLAPVFYGMTWTLIPATEDYKFVTSDNPLYYTDPTHDPHSPYGVGLSHKNIEITFPITRKVALLATWDRAPTGYIRSLSQIVKAISGRTVMAAERYVYSSQHSPGLSRLVQKWKDYSPGITIS
jgi:hypothetical protein